MFSRCIENFVVGKKIFLTMGTLSPARPRAVPHVVHCADSETTPKPRPKMGNLTIVASVPVNDITGIKLRICQISLSEYVLDEMHG